MTGQCFMSIDGKTCILLGEKVGDEWLTRVIHIPPSLEELAESGQIRTWAISFGSVSGAQLAAEFAPFAADLFERAWKTLR